MKYLTLLKADIKSQKGSFTGIIALVFIITISLLAVLSIWKNSHTYEEEQIDRLGFGDITWWLLSVPDDKLLEQIRSLDDVGSTETREVGGFQNYYINDSIISGTLIVYDWDDKQNDFYLYNTNLTGTTKEPEALQKGAVFVPVSFCSLFDAQIGDTLEIGITGREDTASYTIQGYFEDPFEGSAMMGIKCVIMRQDDRRDLFEKVKEAGENALPNMEGSMVHVWKAPESRMTIAELQRHISEATEIKEMTAFTYSKTAIMGFMLILQDIFSGFLLVFVLVLVIVTMIIIGHSISSSIEQDYVDMGILKAVGFTKTDLRIVQLLQYLVAVLCGMIPGIPMSKIVVKLINRLTVTVTGLMIPADIPVGISLLALGLLTMLILLFICMKTIPIGGITPIRAIRGGAEDVYFKSRLTAAVHKKGINFWLAYRQLISGKKQYFSVCLVAALLVFFFSLTARLDAWLGPDGKGLMDTFGAVPYDLGVQCESEETAEEVETIIASRAGIIDKYKCNMTRGLINEIEYLANVVDRPEYYNMVEGRTCLYQNELVITEIVADELGAGIGDTVSVTWPGREEDMEYIISGIYQCANDMGSNFGVSKEGYERLVEETDEMWYYIHYQLEDPSMVQELVTLLDERYGEQISLDENTWSGSDAILLAMSALTVFMYVISVVFIMVAVSLTGSKVLYKEQHDMGIYKSLGFLSANLRFAFALRFAMVAALGACLGIVLSACLTDPLVTAVLKMCGVSRFASTLTPVQMVSPAIVVSALFLAFAYLAAGKIKKVEPGILIVE